MRICISALRAVGRTLLLLAAAIAYAVGVLEKREELLARADDTIDLARYS